MGKLTILFKSGSKLIASDVGGTSDPYCSAKLKLWGAGEVKSKKVLKTLNPVWNDTHELALKEKNDILLIEVWDWDRIGKDEALGFVEVQVNTLQQGANDLTLKLEDVKSGEISVTITADFTGCGTKPQPTPSELGFDIISPFSAVAVRQRLEKAEMLSGNLMETENQYDVFDPVKYKGTEKVHLFNLKEQSSAAARAGGVFEKTAADKIGSQSSIGRSGDMSVHCRSPQSKNLIHFTAVKLATKGSMANKLGNFLQGGMTWEVKQVPSNTIIGYVSAAGGDITVLNSKQEIFYTISGDAEAAKKGLGGKIKAVAGTDQKFLMQVVVDPKKPDKTKEVGSVTKKWGGLTKEALSDADNYHVEFPKGATPEVKVLSLYACLAVDYVHFEKGGLSTYVTVAETISTGGANLVVDVTYDYARDAAVDYAMGEAQGAAIGAAAGQLSGKQQIKYADPRTMSSGSLVAAVPASPGSAVANKDNKDKKDKDKGKDKDKDKDKKDKDKGKDKDKDKGKDKDKKDKDKDKDKKDKDKDKDKKKDKKK